MIFNKYTGLLASLFLAVSVQAQTISRQSVSFSHYVEPESSFEMSDRGQQQSSRAYFKKITGAQLNRGIDLDVDGEGALVQISPFDQSHNGQRISKTSVPVGMLLSRGNLQRNVDSDDIAMHRRSRGLKESFPELYGRAHVMQIPEDMGRGRFQLKAPDNAENDAEFMVYVFDKNSEISLELNSQKSRYELHNPLSFTATTQGINGAKLAAVEAQLLSPGGTVYQVPGRLRGGRFSSSWPIAVKEKRRPGELWQLQVRASVTTASGDTVERVSQVALDVYTPTAELQGVTSTPNTLEMNLAVQQSGRYEARALVFGTDENGAQKPLLLAYQAQWLVPGQQTLTVPIDVKQLESSGLAEPFSVNWVKLLDQGRMSVLESREGNWSLN